MVTTLDGLQICENCADEFAERKMDGEHCRTCARELGDD